MTTTTTKNHGNHGLGKDYHSMTPMLISISILFLITQPPYRYIMYRIISDGDHSVDFMAKWSLLHSFCRFLNFVNNVANFFCYCISGKKFKSELVAMVRGWFSYCKNHVTQRNSSATISTVA